MAYGSVDMNEINNFCNGECYSSSVSWGPVDGLKFNPGYPPYRINNQGNTINLNVKTLDMDAVHYGGLLEYNTHNLYGICYRTCNDFLLIMYAIMYNRTDGDHSYL